MNVDAYTKQTWHICPSRGVTVLLKHLLLTTALLQCPGLMGATNKLSGDFRGLAATGFVDVIVQFTHAPTDDDFSSLTQMRGKLKRTFPSIHGALMTLPAAALHGAAARPGIRWISLDRQVSGSLQFAEPTVNTNIALQYGWDGTGIGVAVIDSGIYNHPDLNPRIVHAESFVPGDSSTDDAFGHGTHVAGIVGGDALESTGNSYTYTFRGIVPKANLINLRALRSNGQGTDSAVIAAMDQAIALKSIYGIRVVNLSDGPDRPGKLHSRSALPGNGKSLAGGPCSCRRGGK